MISDQATGLTRTLGPTRLVGRSQALRHRPTAGFYGVVDLTFELSLYAIIEWCLDPHHAEWSTRSQRRPSTLYSLNRRQFSATSGALLPPAPPKHSSRHAPLFVGRRALHSRAAHRTSEGAHDTLQVPRPEDSAHVGAIGLALEPLVGRGGAGPLWYHNSKWRGGQL